MADGWIAVRDADLPAIYSAPGLYAFEVQLPSKPFSSKAHTLSNWGWDGVQLENGLLLIPSGVLWQF